MKKFKLITLAIFSASSLYVNALSLVTSSALSSSSNASSLPASIPSSGVLSSRQSVLPLSISSVPFPSNLISAASVASF